MRTSVVILIAAVALLLLAQPAIAHDAPLPSAQVQVERNGRCTVTVRYDVLAFALDAFMFKATDEQMIELLDAPVETQRARLEEAAERFLKGFEVVCDGERLATIERATAPSAADIQRWKKEGHVPVIPAMLDYVIVARLPRDAKSVAFRFNPMLGQVVLNVARPGQPLHVQMVDPLETSKVLPVTVVPDPEPQPEPSSEPGSTDPAGEPGSTEPGSEPGSGEPGSEPPIGPHPPTGTEPGPPTTSGHTATTIREREPEPPMSVPWWPVLSTFGEIGFHHIIPAGLDHILFVIGLVLLSREWRPLLAQTGTFTVAHSITLGLAMSGVVHVPSAIVEPVIALSIAYVAVENIFTTRLQAWRLWIVFAFGLVHGLGFAGAIAEMRVPDAAVLPALAGFNIGLEIGQITVIAAVLLLLCWIRTDENWRRYITIPGSVAIFCCAMVWTVERVIAVV